MAIQAINTLVFLPVTPLDEQLAMDTVKGLRLDINMIEQTCLHRQPPSRMD